MLDTVMKKIIPIPIITMLAVACSGEMTVITLTHNTPTGQYHCARFDNKLMTDDNPTDYTIQLTKKDLILKKQGKIVANENYAQFITDGPINVIKTLYLSNSYYFVFDIPKVIEKYITNPIDSDYVWIGIDKKELDNNKKILNHLKEYADSKDSLLMETQDGKTSYFCMKNQETLNALVAKKQLTEWW